MSDLQPIIDGPVPPQRITSVSTVANAGSELHGTVNAAPWVDASTERATVSQDGFSQGTITRFRGNSLVIPTGQVS